MRQKRLELTPVRLPCTDERITLAGDAHNFRHSGSFGIVFDDTDNERPCLSRPAPQSSVLLAAT